MKQNQNNNGTCNYFCNNMPNQMYQNQMHPVNGTVLQQPEQKEKPKKKKKKNLSGPAKVLLIFSILGVLIGCGAFIIVSKYTKQVTVFSVPGAPILGETEKIKKQNETLLDEGLEIVPTTESPVSGLQADKWDGKSRITCLAMGLDYRDWVANDGTPRSDTMILLTYDPITNEAGMLSLPRDLWVAIPDHGYGRINTAYSMGEGEKLPGINGKPGGGAGLAMRTVELFLGVEIQYYAVVDFYGFMDFIDAIDKLPVNVRDDIWVDPLGPGNTIHLRAGVQDLDGATALAYARQRYTNGGDFERAQRQQDVIFALHKQIRWQLPELLTTKFDAVFASIQRAVKTNIPISDMIKLAWTAVDIDPYKVKREVIAPPYQVEYGRTNDGTQDILIPIPDKIRETRDKIFISSPTSGNFTSERSVEDLIREEQAKVTLVNGCYDTEKVNKTVALLQQYGIQVTAIEAGYPGWTNTLSINTGKPYTGKFLVEMMGIPTNSVYWKYDPASSTDLTITLADVWCNALQ
ncbi:MAG: LCP family protein [Anaerolineaceae bacterium]|nr:LCP family protein [Anaerolineaceae bacterium]